MTSFLNRAIRLECRLCNHLMFWVFILSFHTFFPAIYSNENWYNILVNNLYYIPFDVVAVYITIYILIPRFLLKGRSIQFTLFVLFVIFFLFLNTLVGNWLFSASSNSEKVSVFKVFFQSSVTSSFIITLASIVKILRQYHSIKMEKVKIENINLQNELEILKSQITPHFLFNTLNNIDELIYIDKEKASSAIYQLSSILRSMLGEMSNDRVLLDTEIKFIENYLKLASYNFKDSESISIKKNGDFTGKSIAPMIFLPLVENAIKYSDRTADGQVISIEISINGSLMFSIKNKTKGIDQRSTSTGIGYRNLYRRLEHIYPGKYWIEVKNEGREYWVHLKVEV